jgi:hypothetical protein
LKKKNENTKNNNKEQQLKKMNNNPEYYFQNENEEIDDLPRHHCQDHEKSWFSHMDDFLYELPNMFEDESIYVKQVFLFVYRATSIYLLWIGLHYVAAHLYAYHCVPMTWMGFLYSPFMTVTPECKALRWVIYNGGNSIEHMWITMGLWIMSHLSTK